MTKKYCRIQYKTSTTYVQVCLSDYTSHSSLSSELLLSLLCSLDKLVLPSSVCSFSSSDEINTCLTLREARQVTAFYFVWYFSTNFKMAVSRISSLLLSVHAFMFPAISKESLIVSCFNLSLWLDHKVVNVLNTLSTALFDNERPKINLAKS